MAEARKGFFPIVIGDQVSLRQGGSIALMAKDNLQITQGGGQLIGAGNSISVSQGGSWVMGAGSSITVSEGGAGIVAARSFRAERAYVGVAVGRQVEIESSRVLLGSAGTLLAGAVIGLILGWLGTRRS